MIGYLLKRLISLVLTLLVATLVIFIMIEVVPGDPAAYMMGLSGGAEAANALRSELGLDADVTSRYFTWVMGMVQGDFGISYTYRIPISELISSRFQISGLPYYWCCYFQLHYSGFQQVDFQDGRQVLYPP